MGTPIREEDLPPEVRAQAQARAVISEDELPPEVRAQLAPQAPAAAPKQKPTKGEAFGRGVTQGASLGFADEASGFGGFLADKIQGAVPRTAQRGFSDKAESWSGYDIARDNERQANAEAQQAHPGYYAGGEIAGGLVPTVATSAVPIASLGRFGKFLQQGGKLARAAKTGAVQGAMFGGATGAGKSEADTAGGVVEDALTGAAVGGTIGAAAPYAVDKAGRTVGRLAEPLRKAANRQRVGATGAYGGDVKRLAKDKGQDALQRFGQTIEDEGMHVGEGALGGAPQSWGTYAENAAKVVDDAGAKIGGLSRQASGRVSVDVKPMVDDMLDEAVKLEGLRTPEARAALDDLLERAEMLDKGPMDYAQALDLRKFLDKIAWSEKGAGNGIAAERARDTATKIRSAMMESAQKEAPELAAEILKQNQRYEAAIWTQQMAEKRIAQESGNQIFSLPAVVAGAGGLALGPSGMAAGVAAQLMKTRGHSALAGAARGTQRAAETAGSALTSETGSAVAQTAARSASPQFVGQRSMAMATPSTPEQAAEETARVANNPKYRAWLRENAKRQEENRP